MEQHTSIDIAAPPGQVWVILRDVERWPEWTASMRAVTLLDGGVRVGARARVDQPRLPTSVWTVTGLTEGREFTWAADGPGISTVGRHIVEGTGARSCRVTLSISQSGWLGSIVGRGYRSLTDRYLGMEAAGLKARAESTTPGENP